MLIKIILYNNKLNFYCIIFKNLAQLKKGIKTVFFYKKIIILLQNKNKLLTNKN